MNDTFVYMQSLKNLYPKIAKEWHPTKNGNLKPEGVTVGSDKKVWWKCPKGEDHEWKVSVAHRSRGRGCPFCAGKRASKDYNLAVLSPDLAKEWHPTKNGNLKPEGVTVGSDKKVWWKCSRRKAHEWESTVANRFYGRGCPFCSGRRGTK